jgi:hypothetical protein
MSWDMLSTNSWNRTLPGALMCSRGARRTARSNRPQNRSLTQQTGTGVARRPVGRDPAANALGKQWADGRCAVSGDVDPRTRCGYAYAGEEAVEPKSQWGGSNRFRVERSSKVVGRH